MRPFNRFLLLQVPGWLIVGLLLAALGFRHLVPAWGCGVLFMAWIVKDLVLYPFTSRAYGPPLGPGARLIGQRGVAREPLDPEGYVEVRGELWHAEARTRVPPGALIRIEAVRGLTLIVVEDRREAM
jgi:membrane protein implicated in regulation of membrane protease activity